MDQQNGDLNNLLYRARELKRLGNSDAEIRAVLLRQGASGQDADAILAQLRPAGKKSGGGCLPWLAAGLVLAVLAGGALAALYLFPRAAPAREAPAQTAEPLSFLYNLMLPVEAPTETAPVPTQAAPLPPIAEDYFAVIWNLQGDPIDKARQFAAAVPPIELLTTHAELAAAFSVYGKADEDLKAMDLKIELECTGSSSNYCKNLLWEKVKIELDRDKAHSDFYELWLRACKPWQEYYESVGAVFPYLPMQCKYP